MSKKVLLYSGGMDSWLIDKIWEPDVKLYIDVQSRYSNEEISRLPKDVEIVKLNLGQWEQEDAIIPLRNLYFVMVASYYGDTICLGATAGDRLHDKSWEFANIASNTLSFLYQPQRGIPNGRDIKVILDFKNFSKGELLKLYLLKGGDIEKAAKESFSCYTPIDGKECWSCRACFRKYIAFKVNRYDFGPNVDTLIRDFVQNEYDLEKEAYGRFDETKEILSILGKEDNQ